MSEASPRRKGWRGLRWVGHFLLLWLAMDVVTWLLILAQAPLPSAPRAAARRDDRLRGEAVVRVLNLTDAPVLVREVVVGDQFLGTARRTNRPQAVPPGDTGVEVARLGFDRRTEFGEMVFRRGAEGPEERLGWVMDRRQPRDCEVLIRIVEAGPLIGPCREWQPWQ